MPKEQTKSHPLLVVRKSVAEVDPSISNQQRFSELIGISMSVVGGVENYRYELGPQDRLKVSAATGVDPGSLERGKEAVAMNGKPYSPQLYLQWRKMLPNFSTPENKVTVQEQGGLMLQALAEVAFRDPAKAIRFILDLDHFLHQQAEVVNAATLPGVPANHELSIVMGNSALEIFQRTPELQQAYTKTYTLTEASDDPAVWADISKLPEGKIWIRVAELHPPRPDAKIFEILEVPKAPAFDHLIGKVSGDRGNGIAVIKATKRVWRVRLMIENAPSQWEALLELAGSQADTVAKGGP